MKKYQVTVNGEAHIVTAYSARVAINKILKSVIGTRTADKMLPLTIKVEGTKRNV